MDAILKIGYLCGCFDLFHTGHLAILEKCKQACDYLIVGVCDDNHIRLDKKREPVYNEIDRLKIVSALKCVDKAILVTHEETLDKLLAWKRIGFNVLFNGSDWIGTERSVKAEADFKSLDVKIQYFPYTAGISTSTIIEKIKHDA